MLLAKLPDGVVMGQHGSAFDPTAKFVIAIFHADVHLTSLIEQAYGHLLRCKYNLVVAHNTHQTVIITVEKGVIPVPRDYFVALHKLVKERYSKKYFSTQLTTVEHTVPVCLQDFTQYWAKLGLFTPYEYSDLTGPQFGFVAGVEAGGFWITGRGSNKEITPKWSYVSSVDFTSHNICSANNKASLNAPLAARIFAARPDIRYIVHFHFKLPSACVLPHDTTPGTLEDALACDGNMSHNVFYQPHHGSIVLLNDLSQWVPLLQKESVYATQAQRYNTLYSRFLRQDKFLDFIRLQAPEATVIGDIGCGTGESTRALLTHFSEVTLIEPAPAMLAEARKLHPTCPFQNESASTFQDMFDLLVMRQAFNYLDPAQYYDIFTHIYQHLLPNGLFVFNTFAPVTQTKTRYSCSDAGEHHTENSILNNGVICHMQTLVSPNDNVLDYNQFFNTDIDTIQRTMEHVGFTVTVQQNGNSLYFACKKI